jgi:hypothetical protein
MVAMMHLLMRCAVMVGYVLPPVLQSFGWIATATMAVTVIAMATWLLG